MAALCDPTDCIVRGILQARILEWVNRSLLQGIFQTQGLNPDLSHYRQICYQLSLQGNPRIPMWVAYPFFIGSSQPRNRTSVSCIAGGFNSAQDDSGNRADGGGGAVARVGEGVEEFGLPLPQLRDRGKIDGD